MLERIFQLDPENRITSKEALMHPYFESYHDPDDEPDAKPFDDSFETYDYSLIQWKSNLIKNFHIF